MRRDLIVLAAWFAVAGGVLLVVGSRPLPEFGVATSAGDAPQSGDVAGRVLPTLDELQGLRFAAGDGLPAWTAARAVPASASGPLTLAGAWHGLELEEVRVELGEDVYLVAATGHLAERVLTLGPLSGEVGARRALVAAGARIAADEVGLAGPVVFEPGDPEREAVVRAWSGGAAELRSRLRR